jgi:hypothetical protein
VQEAGGRAVRTAGPRHLLFAPMMSDFRVPWAGELNPQETLGTAIAATAKDDLRRYFRRRRVRLARPRIGLGFPSRFAFAATCCRYRRTTSCPDAPVIRLAEASSAAAIFSLTISLASRRAALPPRISFTSRSAITLFASTANIIKGLNKQPPSRPRTRPAQQRAAECQPLSMTYSAKPSGS